MVATPSDFRVDPERTALTLPPTQNDSTTEGEPSGSEQAQQRSDKAGIDLQTFFVLEENEQSAIRLAVTNGRVTAAELADERGLTLRVARNVLRQLTEGGLLEWEGKGSRDPRQYYRIETVRFDGEGNMLGEMAGSVETFSPFPTFGIVRPAVPNTRADCSPCGQSVFADAVDAVQSVDLAYDALINEVDVDYFDFDKVGYVRTATEVSSDNSALMRNVRKHENAPRKPITDVSRALMACARGMGVPVPDEGDVRVAFDDGIIQDTEAEKKQDMAGVAAGLILPWEYCSRWYGEYEATARRSISEVVKVAGTAGVGE